MRAAGVWPFLVMSLACRPSPDLAVRAAGGDRPTAPRVLEAEGPHSDRSPPPEPAPLPGRQAVEVEMQNVSLRVTKDVILRVQHLRGRFVPLGRSGMPFLDDKGSYLVVIDSGRIAMDMASLNALMSDHVLGHGRSNVEDLQIGVDEGYLEQKGKLDKAIDVPFKVKGELSASADGRIRVHPKSIKGFGLPVKGLMKVLGIEMDDMMEVEPGHGVELDDNDLLLDPEEMLPPPRIRGRVTQARLEGNLVVQTFGAGRPRRLVPRAIGRNHIYWRGGDLRFGKLTMAQTDLELIDQDPSDPFDFSVDHWNDQLVAGYSKSTPQRGLKSYMPDYGDLEAERRVASRPARRASPRARAGRGGR